MNQTPWSILRFTVHLTPRGQARARAAVVTDRNGNAVRSQKTGRVVIVHHKDKRQESDEQKLHALLLEHRPEQPLQGPILLGVKAFMPIPQSRPKKWREAALAGDERPESKPDLDNVLKHLKDVMTGTFWTDDKQVVGYLPDTGKFYSDAPRYEVTVMFRKDRQ
ncbi:MAG: RusA family crossover junction endodeoxyribonuclease [Acidobacteriota bacterium]